MIPPVEEEIEMIRLLGAEVWALTLNDENLDEESGRSVQKRLEKELEIPAVFPLWDGIDRVAQEVLNRVSQKGVEN